MDSYVKPKRKAFKPTFEVFSEDPQEEELDKEEQKRAAEEAKKPKVPKRTSEPFGFRVEKKKSKAPGLPSIIEERAPDLPTIHEVDEGAQQKPDRTPARKDKDRGQKR